MKSVKFLFMLISLLIAAGFSAQSRSLPEEGNGNVIKEVRDNLSAFTEVEAGGVFDILLIQGENYVVTIETDENLMSKVKTTVKDKRLELEAANVDKATKLYVIIESPEYTGVFFNGACNAETQGTLKAKNIVVELSGATEAVLAIDAEKMIEAVISGASDAEISGSAETFNAIISGAANLEAGEMIANKASVVASGVSNATVFAVEKGDAVISGVSDVEFIESGTAIYNIVREGQATKDGKYKVGAPGVSVTTDDESVSVDVGDIEVDVRDGESTRVRIGGREVVVDEDGNVDISKVKKTRFDGHWGGIHLGVNGFMTSDNTIGVPAGSEYLEPRYQRSFQFNLNLYEQNINLIRNKLGLVTGIGFQWNNYFMSNNVFFRGDSSMVYGIAEDNDLTGRTYEKSKLVVSYLSVPLLMEYQTNKYSRSDSFHLTAGMIMGVQLRAHTKNVFYDNGKNKAKGWEDYNLSPFRWDAYAGIGWGKVNLFASYALNAMFKENKGPEVYPFTVGITLLGW